MKYSTKSKCLEKADMGGKPEKYSVFLYYSVRTSDDFTFGNIPI